MFGHEHTVGDVEGGNYKPLGAEGNAYDLFDESNVPFVDRVRRLGLVLLYPIRADRGSENRCSQGLEPSSLCWSAGLCG